MKAVVVPRAGIEPALPKEPHFECGASTNSASGALCSAPFGTAGGLSMWADRFERLMMFVVAVGFVVLVAGFLSDPQKVLMAFVGAETY